jgi:hypothetical protein
MRAMQIQIAILMTVLTFISCTIKLEVTKDTFDKTCAKLLPYVLSKVPIKIPDQKFIVSEAVVEVSVDIENVSLFTTHFNSDTFRFTLKEPNSIIVEINKLQLHGNLDLGVSASIIGKKENIKLDVNDLSLEVELVLTSLRNNRPSGYISSIKLHKLDYDFNIGGNIIGLLGNMFKENLKNIITKKINNLLKSDLKSQTEGLLNDLPSEFQIPIVDGVKALLSFPNKVAIKNGSIHIDVDVDYTSTTTTKREEKASDKEPQGKEDL